MSVFFIAYSTILAAELLGDKTLYTLSALATRFRLAPILAGAALAFALKMAAAVLLGHAISRLPVWLVTALSGATFIGMGVGIFLQLSNPAREPPASLAKRESFTRGSLTAFTAIFLPEWGDPGQLAAALLAAQGHSSTLVWAAGTLAMTTKALLAGVLGLGLRRVVPVTKMRWASAVMFVTLGILALFRVEL